MQQWRNLAILVVVVLILVGVTVTWSAIRRKDAPAVPAILPGAVIQPLRR
jgi:hypothetical protein